MDRSKPLGINAFALKVLAILAMTMDHTAYIFYEALGGWAIWMRVIGRWTFPIMAFLLTEGLEKTRSAGRYAARLVVFAFLSMVPFYLIFGDWKNVLFTLLGGLLLLWGQREVRSRAPWLPEWLLQIWFGGLAICLAVLMCGFDWGFPGILAVYCVGQAKGKPYWLQGLICCGALTIAQIFSATVLQGAALTESYLLFICGVWVAWAWLSLYNGQRGRGMKYFFYAYYPLHLLVLYGVIRLAAL